MLIASTNLVTLFDQGKSHEISTLSDGTDWIIETVDDSGNVGLYSSPAADESGNIYCSYYDATNGDLKLAIDLGYGWVIQTIDSKGDVGLFTSLAIDSNGNTFISYYDNTNHNLKFARWDSIEKVWVTETIDGNESTDVGWSTSLVIDSEGRPHISYYDFTHNKLKYATYALYYWVTMYVDDGGLYNSIGITSDGKPCIAYRDANGTLKYAEYHGKQGWLSTIVDETPDVCDISLDVDSSGMIHISYYDSGYIKYAYGNGTEFNVEEVDYVTHGGWGSSISVLYGIPRISYYDYLDKDLKYAERTLDGWQIYTVDSTGNVGQHSSLCLEEDYVHITYYDSTNGDLKRAKKQIPPDIILYEFYPVQVVKGAGVIRRGIDDTSLGIKVDRPDLVEKKETLIEIWYWSFFPNPVQTDIVVKVFDSTGTPVKTVRETRWIMPGFHKLGHGDASKWVPPANQYLKDEITKPKVTIRVEIVPVPGEANPNNNVLEGEFDVKRGELSILYFMVGRQKADLPLLITDFLPIYIFSSDFIDGTYPVSSVRAGINPEPLLFNPVTGKLPFEDRETLYITLAVLARVSGYDRGIGIVKKGWIFDNFQPPPGKPNEWRGTVGVCIPAVAGVLCEVGYISTPAHEIGHTYGLWIGREEYDLFDPGKETNVYWVEKRGNAPHELQRRGYCFMGYAPRQWSYFNKGLHVWVDVNCYSHLYNRITQDPEVILVNGFIEKNGTAEFGTWYHLPKGSVDINIGDRGDYTFVLLDEGGHTLGEAGFNVSFCEKGNASINADSTAFAFTIPWINGTKEIQLKDRAGSILASRIVSDNSPVVTLISPNGGETFMMGDNITISWDAYDLDGDNLTFAVLYSYDNESWFPITITSGNNCTWNTKWIDPGNYYRIKIIATDGINTAQDESDGTFTILPNSNPPVVSIEKPEDALYIFGSRIFSLPIPVIIGNISIEAIATDDVGISNVSFYVDDELKYVDYTPPYTWLWDERAMGLHRIKVIAYDLSGNPAVDEKRVLIINLNLH